jgi:hypothetical protein
VAREEEARAARRQEHHGVRLLDLVAHQLQHDTRRGGGVMSELVRKGAPQACPQTESSIRLGKWYENRSFHAPCPRHHKMSLQYHSRSSDPLWPIREERCGRFCHGTCSPCRRCTRGSP